MLEEKNTIGEQPKDLNVHAEVSEEMGTNNLEGSPLGKFKDADSLLGAYNELQSEFTRKCQKLSDVQKQLNEIQTNSAGNSLNLQSSNEDAWNVKLDDFLQKHNIAENFVEQITNEIINDDNLNSSDDALEKAYIRVMENNYIPQESLAKDEKFLDKYIYSNNEIKNKIINEYVNSLQNIQSPINVSNVGQMGNIAHSPKFNNITDANKYVENMFKF